MLKPPDEALDFKRAEFSLRERKGRSTAERTLGSG